MRGVDRSHIQTDEDDPAGRRGFLPFCRNHLSPRSSPLEWPGKPRTGLLRRREPAINLEAVRPFTVGDLTPRDGFGIGDLQQVEVLTVDHSDSQGVAVGQDRSLRIGHDQVVDVGLLGRFHEEFLKLKIPPAQTDPRSGAGLKRTDQGRPLLHEETGRLLLLPVDVHQGQKTENRDEDHDRPDDQPGRGHRPEPFPHIRLSIHHPPPYSGYLLTIWIPQVDTCDPLFLYPFGRENGFPRGK